MFRRTLYLILISLSFLAVPEMTAKQFTVVIDAGHGGKDAGACGSSLKEKNLTLKYALAFGKILEQNCPDVKVVYTRKTDVFLELCKRAEIANKNKADLFISVHINALDGNKNTTGIQTYTLGRGETTGKKGIQENLEVAKRENSVIYLEKDYRQTYHGFDPNSPESNIMFEFMQDKNMEKSIELARLMQKHLCATTGRRDKGAHQNNLAVLRLTSMPGCLLELGYISTPSEAEFLNTKDALQRYTRGFYKAFNEYRKKYEKGPTPPVSIDPIMPELDESPTKPDNNKPSQEKKEDGKTNETAGNSPVFKVQLSYGDKKLSVTDRQFKGVKNVECNQEGRMYRYTVGSSTDYNEIYRLRKEIAKTIPDAFIIAFKNGKKMDIEEAKAEFRKNRGK
ncbi:MAG: N-acetylmuramoyl-L-alanine amidase [Prevotella sp.]|nr:N-acetylmuramoyl-L-alanine amidase [Prevotella sp.]